MASTLAREPVTLRARRAALGISQQRLAELAGCSLSMVRVLESGYEPETSRVLDRIDRVLNDETQPGEAASRTSSAVMGDGHAP
jgi:transcriptional regulator with XRE-family HTH domain